MNSNQRDCGRAYYHRETIISDTEHSDDSKILICQNPALENRSCFTCERPYQGLNQWKGAGRPVSLNSCISGLQNNLHHSFSGWRWEVGILQRWCVCLPVYKHRLSRYPQREKEKLQNVYKISQLAVSPSGFSFTQKREPVRQVWAPACLQKKTVNLTIDVNNRHRTSTIAFW